MVSKRSTLWSIWNIWYSWAEIIDEQTIHNAEIGADKNNEMQDGKLYSETDIDIYNSKASLRGF